MAGKVEGLTIGIDLGTTYSCVAVWKNDGIEIIPNDLGNRTTPSCVAFTEEEQLIGEAAVNQAVKNPTNTIFSVKRLMGRAFSETCVQEDINKKLWQCKVVADAANKPMIGIQCEGKEKQFSPEQISSMILGKMRDSAEAFLGSEVKNAVITVPSYFNVVQRQATKDAATMAGLNVVRIINEPVAAALAYGLNNNIGSKIKKNVLVFDLGGGTFDVTILTIEKGKFKVKSYGGDTHLGGDDFDSRLVEHFIKEFQKRHNKDIRENQRAIRRLRTRCEKTKRMLSSRAQTPIEIEALYGGTDLDFPLYRAKFEDINRDLFAKCIEHVEDCLKHASINKNDIDDIVLVGGSTRIPKIQQLLQDCFHGKKLCKSINPDEAVAYGAAVLAANLSGVRERNLVLMDVTPLSLGNGLHDGTMLVVIPKNTPIPCMMEQEIVTAKDDQIWIMFEILEGESARKMDNICLGKMTISGIPPAPRGQGLIKTWFSVDKDGILTVRAKSKTKEEEVTFKDCVGRFSAISSKTKEKEVTFKDCVGRFSAKEIDQIIQDAERYKKKDEKYRRNAEAKNEFENLQYKLKIAIKDDKITSKMAKMAKEDIKKMAKMAKEDIKKMNEAMDQGIEFYSAECSRQVAQFKAECSSQVAQFKAALDSVISSSHTQTNAQQKPHSNVLPAIEAAATATTLLQNLTGDDVFTLLDSVLSFLG